MYAPEGVDQLQLLEDREGRLRARLTAAWLIHRLNTIPGATLIKDEYATELESSYISNQVLAIPGVIDASPRNGLVAETILRAMIWITGRGDRPPDPHSRRPATAIERTPSCAPRANRVGSRDLEAAAGRSSSIGPPAAAVQLRARRLNSPHSQQVLEVGSVCVLEGPNNESGDLQERLVRIERDLLGVARVLAHVLVAVRSEHFVEFRAVWIGGRLAAVRRDR